MPTFKPKLTRHTKKLESVTQTQKKQSIETMSRPRYWI